MGETEFRMAATPNPNSIRIGLSAPLFPKAQSFTSAAQAEANPLAKDLLAIPGVTLVFMLKDFISINKDPGADWGEIEPKVAEVLMKHLNA